MEYIIPIIQGGLAIMMTVGGFIVRGINVNLDKIENRMKEDRLEIINLINVIKLDFEKKSFELNKYNDLKIHDNEKRIERIEDTLKDQDQNHSAFRESAAEKFATRQELKDATQQQSATLVRLEQKIDSLSNLYNNRREND